MAVGLLRSGRSRDHAIRHLSTCGRRRLRRRFFQSAADRTVKVIMGDEGVSVSTALGASTIPWRAIERVWEGRSVVLFFYHGWQYVAFPIDAMPRAALEFASQRVASRRNTTGV